MEAQFLDYALTYEDNGSGITNLVTEIQIPSFVFSKREVFATVLIRLLVLDRQLNDFQDDGFQIQIGTINEDQTTIENYPEYGPIIFSTEEPEEDQEEEYIVPDPLSIRIQRIKIIPPNHLIVFQFQDLNDRPLKIYGDINLTFSVGNWEIADEE